MPMRLMIVDDEPLARDRLRRLVEEVGAAGEPAARVVAEAGSAGAAEAWLARPGEAVDAVLLDIGLPGPSGLALAARLRALPWPPAVVFVTAHAEHALAAFDLQALDYLTKPVRRERLRQALARVARWLGARGGDGPVGPAGPAAAPPPQGAGAAAPAVLVLHERGRVLRLPHDEILCLRAEHKTVVVRTSGPAGGRHFVVDESLNDLEQRLGERFLRVHRNALVALAAIRALELRPGADDESGEGGDGWAVRIGGGGEGGEEWLAVSRRQVASVKAALARGPTG